ncbi:CPBP family intramembrane glutamic endopeptidase [Ornithinimicrobium flavum]|uniref:CPBP family intramembrane glutamic endopeptidase n=1 Tax=Ornithinimicrobium flavum TaxID=1288636 RepID=UPI00106FD494|nr:CPBP family intramembrane glutamic endopeptidase [Ornithinimicrobium flavum]
MTSLEHRPAPRGPERDRRPTFERPVTGTDLLLTLASFLVTTALTALLLLGLVVAGAPLDTAIVLALTTGVVLWLGGIAWALRRRGWTWDDLGLGPVGERTSRAMLWQVPLAWLTTIVLTAVVGALLLDPSESNAVASTQAALNLGPAALVGLAVAVVGIGPFVEEIIFRRVLLGWLEARTGVLLALVGQAVLFAVLHVLPQAMVLTFFLGLATGILARRHRSLWPAVALHATNNAVALLAVATTLR